MIKVLLAPSLADTQALDPDATVEAEYGTAVVLGRHATLAHHAPGWTHNPAPCVAEVGNPLPDGATIVVSHVDLDTIGGVLALMGEKPQSPAFWEAAAFVDTHGPHRVREVGPRQQRELRAWWAWNAGQPRKPRVVTEVTEVTSDVLNAGEVLFEILAGDEDLLSAGDAWAASVEVATETCVVAEDSRVRVFVTERVFCSASYYSPKQRTVVPATATWNTTTGAVTIACEGGQFDARQIAQSLWGPEAGGHVGIAGSPRGKKMTREDLDAAAEAVRSALASH